MLQLVECQDREVRGLALQISAAIGLITQGRRLTLFGTLS